MSNSTALCVTEVYLLTNIEIWKYPSWQCYCGTSIISHSKPSNYSIALKYLHTEIAVLQGSDARQWHRKVHFSWCFTQLHCFVEHGLVVLHPHFTSFTRAPGAITVPSGVTCGTSIVQLDGVYHPWSVGDRGGGSGFTLPFITAAARWARRTFWNNAASVGGRDFSFGGSRTLRAILRSHERTWASFKSRQSARP